jgi:hypothetical protein
MSRVFAGLVAGAIAGAAGATALNVVTYADMAFRGRSASSRPEAAADAMASTAGAEVPGDAEETKNRKSGLGNIAGIGVGVGLGAITGVLRAFHVKVPKPLAPFVMGLAAMAVSDGVMSRLEVTDPRTWDAKSVAADALPHLAYGFVQTAALHRMLDPRTPQVS